MHYRPDGVSRHEAPADVCDPCSDFEVGRLVPVSFCPDAARHSAEEYGYLAGGPRPEWMWLLDLDAARWTPPVTLPT